jgi:hypothetical protein
MAKDDIMIQMRSDLMTFSNLLRKYLAYNDKYGVLIEFGDIQKTLKDIKIGGKDCWKLEDISIVFKNLDLGGDICPKFVEGFEKEAKIKLICEMSGLCKIPDDTVIDPILPITEKNFSGFSLQLIMIIGDFNDHIAKASWHFDRHPDKKLDGKNEENPSFDHPLYHLHFGGKEINQGQIEYGGVLILEAPRLLHPPMDIVLAVDFVLSNFYSRDSGKVNSLRDDPQYQKIVKRSKDRFWKPFFLGLASNFIGNDRFSFQGINHLSVDKTFAQNLFSYDKNH